MATKLAQAGVLAMAVAAASAGPASARDTGRPVPAAERSVAAVAIDSLPPEARQTHRLILQGGPFPHSKDGVVFGNRERLLPQHPRGHYREYTVATPGASNRGARRIVCGGTPPTRPQACFYTDDHYASFRLIDR